MYSFDVTGRNTTLAFSVNPETRLVESCMLGGIQGLYWLITYRKHGPEVAEVGEDLIHRRLLGVDGEELDHAAVQGGHVGVSDHQLLLLLPG